MGFLIGILLLVLSLPLQAEDRADFSGTWINSRFKEALKQHRSLLSARDAIENSAPVWIAVDTDKGGKSVNVSFTGDAGSGWSLEYRTLEGVGKSWVLSDSTGPKWLVTVDVQGHLYLLLHDLKDQSVPPIVLTRSYARVQDPTFHIGQIITSELLTGTYVGADGKEYSFNQDMTAKVAGQSMRFTIKLNPATNSVFVLLSDVQGNISPFLVERKEEKLILTDRKGKKTELSTSGM